MHAIRLLAFIFGLTQLASTSPTCSQCHPELSEYFNRLVPRRGGGSAGARGSSGGTRSGGVGSSSSGATGGSSGGVGNGSSGGKGSSSSGGTGSRSGRSGRGSSGSAGIINTIMAVDEAYDGAAALMPGGTVWVTGLVAATVALGGFGV